MPNASIVITAQDRYSDVVKKLALYVYLFL